MYKSIQIKNFRGIEDLTISDLGRVNLIVGANNVGKTSVLEALALLHMHLDGYELQSIIEGRGYRDGDALDRSISGLMGPAPTAAQFTVSGTKPDGVVCHLVGARVAPPPLPNDHCRIIAHYLTGFNLMGQESLTLGYSICSGSLTPLTQQEYVSQQSMPLSRLGEIREYPRRFQQGHFGEVSFLPATGHLRTTTLAELLSRLDERADSASLVPVLENFDQKINDLFVGYSVAEKQPTVSVKIDKVGGLPIHLIGDGLRRLIDIMATVPLAGDGLALIDEVESGIYYENYSKLFC